MRIASLPLLANALPNKEGSLTFISITHSSKSLGGKLVRIFLTEIQFTSLIELHRGGSSDEYFSQTGHIVQCLLAIRDEILSSSGQICPDSTHVNNIDCRIAIRCCRRRCSVGEITKCLHIQQALFGEMSKADPVVKRSS